MQLPQPPDASHLRAISVMGPGWPLDTKGLSYNTHGPPVWASPAGGAPSPRLPGRVGCEGPGLSLTASQPRWVLSGPETPRTKSPHIP